MAFAGKMSPTRVMRYSLYKLTNKCFSKLSIGKPSRSRSIFTSSSLSTKWNQPIYFNEDVVLRLNTGSLARMAGGAVLATLGDTTVLVTAVSKNQSSSTSFVPLTVEYRMKNVSSSSQNMRILNTARMEKEVLTSRAIDRSVRPMFPPGYFSDTQLTCQLMAVDGHHDPDVICINAASAALAISNIPWNGPIGAVRVGMIDNELIVFPTHNQLKKSKLNLLITATREKLIVMLEANSDNLGHADLLRAMKFGVKHCAKIVLAIDKMVAKVGVEKMVIEDQSESMEWLTEAIELLCQHKLETILLDKSYDKQSRDKVILKVQTDTFPKITEGHPNTSYAVYQEYFTSYLKKILRNLILDQNTRCDGRKPDNIRTINSKVNLFQPLHGSSLFQRGQTQVQSTVAFDSPITQRRVDPSMEASLGARDNNFALSYYFPSYATNEVSTGGRVSRREIGHGALAEKALRYALPDQLDYSVSLLATVLESNGSSSMATVCGGSLALFDAGVKLKEPVAGVAIGLVTRSSDDGIEKYTVLTDILGIEDYFGDMDFKIAGTQTGMTALQMDLKLPGIPIKIVGEALTSADKAKKTILKLMSVTLKGPRTDRQESLPVIKAFNCTAQKRQRLVGPGGVNIRRLESDYGIQLTWTPDGKSVSVFAPSRTRMEEAQELLDDLLQDEPTLEFGAIYTATIVEIKEYGVMVTLYNGMQPVLVHNAQLDTRMILHADALDLVVGSKIKVKYFGRDPSTGGMRLSRKVLQILSGVATDLHKDVGEVENESDKLESETAVPKFV